MKDTFPEIFLSLEKCQGSEGRLYLMNKSDWNYVLNMLNQREGMPTMIVTFLNMKKQFIDKILQLLTKN